MSFVNKTAEFEYFINFPLVFSRKTLSLWRESKVMDAMLIGREKEKQVLQNALYEEYSQFVVVYGRRRVGKTFLIRETFENRFDFQFTGAANLTARKQLVRFRRALKEHGQKDTPELTNWGDAFSELKRFIKSLPEGKKVVFLDELPWMDAPRSGFLSELESFGMDGHRHEKILFLWYAEAALHGWSIKLSRIRAVCTIA